MRAGILPDATWMPGTNAGQNRSGRTSVRSVVCHYTVGVDSTGVGLRGYYHWLVRRDGEIVQSGMAVIIKSPSGERLLAGPLFTGVSAEQLASLRAQGVPTLELAMSQAGEDVANALAAWSARELATPIPDARVGTVSLDVDALADAVADRLAERLRD